MMPLSFGFSPCPNDTFMVDAMLHQKIQTRGVSFNPVIEDVEQLNNRAFQAELDMTKLSYHAFLHLTDKYQMLESGSALGFGVGPLLIARENTPESEIIEGPVALPGKWTTANWLFSLKYPAAKNKEFMLFSDIENAVFEGSVRAGVIIHENRFTYADRGFTKISDLGAFWEQKTGLPIPLGGIAVRRDLDESTKSNLQDMLKESIAFAYQNPASGTAFVHHHAQEMDPGVLRQHIRLYVNDFSLSMGEKGREAIQQMFDLSAGRGLINDYRKDFLFSPLA